MWAELAGQRLLQLGNLLTQSPQRQLGERRRVRRSCDQRLQHVAARLAQDVGGDRGELEVGVLPRFLPPIDHARPLGDYRGALARQVAQLTLGGARNNAAA